MFDTLQDRLVSVLRQQGANGIEDANRVLASFLPEINARFAVLPRQAGSAYRQPPEGLVLESVLKYLRTVANDNTIRFANRIIQLLPDMLRMSYARAAWWCRLDGSIVVSYKGRTVASTGAGVRRHPEGEKVRRCGTPATARLGRPAPEHRRPPSERRNGSTVTTTQRPRKPAPNHLWRRPLRTKSLALKQTFSLDNDTPRHDPLKGPASGYREPSHGHCGRPRVVRVIAELEGIGGGREGAARRASLLILTLESGLYYSGHDPTAPFRLLQSSYAARRLAPWNTRS